MEQEVRITTLEIRTIGETGNTIRGIAAKYNSLSEDLGGFREIIQPGAFAFALGQSDVRALFNHDPNMILGRNTSGTLRLSDTEQGLEFEIDLPDTQYARDLRESMRRGDVNQCSFGFTITKDAGDKWQRDETGAWTRTIMSIDRLYDVSPVTYPAYPETSCAVRSLEKVQADIVKPPIFDALYRRYRLNLV